MISIIALLGIILVAYSWISAMRAKEIAVKASKNACQQRGLQLLDDTVALKKLRFKRGTEGHMQWQRTYQFEYYEGTGQDVRQTSTITLSGATVIALSLTPKNNVIKFAQAKNDVEAYGEEDGKS